MTTSTLISRTTAGLHITETYLVVNRLRVVETTARGFVAKVYATTKVVTDTFLDPEADLTELLTPR